MVFEDAALLVIDKPSGVAVHGGSGVSFGVIESLRAARPQAKFLELAHRLDRDTSGLLIVAKKRSALVELHRMLREGEVEKVYLAVVKGAGAARQLELRESLHKYVTADGERRVSGAAKTARRPSRGCKVLEGRTDVQPARAAPADRPHAPDPRAPRARRAPGPRRRQVRRLRAQPGAGEGGGEAPVPARGRLVASRIR